MEKWQLWSHRCYSCRLKSKMRFLGVDCSGFLFFFLFSFNCRLDSRSIFMLDNGPCILIMVGTNVPVSILQSVFGKLFANCFDER